MTRTRTTGRRHRRWTAAAGCAVLLATAAVAAPAAADPERGEEVDANRYNIWAAEDYPVAVFINTTRETFCTAEMVAAENTFYDWLQAGAEEDPPPFPDEDYGLVDVVFQGQRVARENYRAGFEAQVPVEVWTLESGKSWETLVAPCLDTDGLRDGTDEPLQQAGELLAAGTGTLTGFDNDVFGAGPRSNVWGSRLTADLSGPDGDWTLAARESNHRVRGEYKGGIDIQLKQR